MKEDNIKLEVIPEEAFVSRIKMLHKSYVICDSCAKTIGTTFYPYGYDIENHDVWYIGMCPDCEKVMYVRD